MSGQLPWAYRNKEEFFALPPAERAPHILEALLYLDWAADHPDSNKDVVKRQMEVMSGIAQDVAKAIAAELQDQEAWRDPYDPRWPRFHAGSQDPLYVTGCHPPLLLCLPHDDEQAWKSVEFDESHKEMTEWLRTPAGLYGVPEAMRRSTEEISAQYAESVEKVRESEAEVKRAQARVDAARERLRLAEQRAGLGPKPPKKPRKPD
jgi:hypothetical protein